MNKEQYQANNSQARRQARNRELMIARLESIRAGIIADCTPAINALREASEAMDGIGSRIRGFIADGYTVQPGAMDKYSRTRREHTGDNGNGMEDNNTLWTAGHALAARDSVKA